MTWNNDKVQESTNFSSKSNVNDQTVSDRDLYNEEYDRGKVKLQLYIS